MHSLCLSTHHSSADLQPAVSQWYECVIIHIQYKQTFNTQFCGFLLLRYIILISFLKLWYVVFSCCLVTNQRLRKLPPPQSPPSSLCSHLPRSPQTVCVPNAESCWWPPCRLMVSPKTTESFVKAIYLLFKTGNFTRYSITDIKGNVEMKCSKRWL